MRTLLVDNYDSFTYNLFHHLAEVTGQRPVVITNDEPGWTADRLAEFDNVIISPGPGTPERAGDFGVCRQVIERADRPVLGVCLGHQGIAHLHGATVGRAPEPRHGRESPVLHDGADLFAGLPSPFQVVRYHSLAVTDLPPELVATAWTPDGVLMGLRHRDRPLWGVQFHPESIRTEHGHALLRNFTDLSARWWAERGGRPEAIRVSTPSTAEESGVAAERGARRLRVLVESCPTRWHDEVVHDTLFRGRDHSFWLDSSRPDETEGRFSVFGDATGPLARVVRADVWRGTVTERTAAGETTCRSGFFDWLAADLAGLRTELPALSELPCEFTLGWVGYLGYELKAEAGGNRAHRSEEPDATLVFADRAVVLDHATGTTHLLALVEDGTAGDEPAARAWLADTARALAGIAGVPPAEPDDDGGVVPGTPVTLRHDRERYLDLIGSCLADIASGETYEVCLTNLATAPVAVDPWHGYRRLRRANPVPFGALLDFGDLAVLSTSPERFLRVFRDRTVESKPIKGTRPRGGTTAEDELLRKDLANDEKDRAENLMIVDLVRNDLGRCAEVGSVHVAKIFDVESYATVHQLVSTVRARLTPAHSAVDCVRAAFPGGSMTGAPKIRTMTIIDELEAGPRGVYSGGIGYFSLSGAADLSMVIRTLVVRPDRVKYGVGGAIVALSDPEAEFEETAVKATPLLRLLGAEFPGRVLA